jgi:hypothetical protein
MSAACKIPTPLVLITSLATDLGRSFGHRQVAPERVPLPTYPFHAPPRLDPLVHRSLTECQSPKRASPV